MQLDEDLNGWYYKRDGERIGPISQEAVARLVKSGQLDPAEMLVGIEEDPAEAGSSTRYSYLDAATVASRVASPDRTGKQGAAHDSKEHVGSSGRQR